MLTQAQYTGCALPSSLVEFLVLETGTLMGSHWYETTLAILQQGRSRNHRLSVQATPEVVAGFVSLEEGSGDPLEILAVVRVLYLLKIECFHQWSIWNEDWCSKHSYSSRNRPGQDMGQMLRQRLAQGCTPRHLHRLAVHRDLRVRQLDRASMQSSQLNQMRRWIDLNDHCTLSAGCPQQLTISSLPLHS